MEKKKLLEAKIRKQVASEEKAFRIVERLIENPITEEFLKDSVGFDNWILESFFFFDCVDVKSTSVPHYLT